MESEKNRRLLARFRGRYGESEVLSDPGVTAYSQVHLWKEVVEAAGSLSTEDILMHLPGSKLSLGDDELEMMSNNHVHRRAVIGKAQGEQFRVIWSSARPIEPQPWLGVDTTDYLSRDLILGALKALPEMAAQNSISASQS
jgi:urea transport system substrate-binding protein